MSTIDRPLVSVITPLYNKVGHLEECIDSVQQQSIQDWEMLIVDDFSDDGSSKLLRQLAVDEPRIRAIFNEKNLGAGPARNRAIKLAKGRYIAFLDADDKWKPEKLEKQLQFMQQKKAVLSCTDYVVMKGTGSLSEKRISGPDKISYRRLLRYNCIGCLTAIYDSKKIGKAYMPDLRMRQDYGLWLEILKQGHSAYCLHEVLAEYRQHSSSLSGNKFSAARYNWHLLRKHQKLPLHSSLWFFTLYLGSSLLKYYGK